MFGTDNFGWSGGSGGGGGGLTQVTHDNSLFGLGTVGTPLGVSGYYNNVFFVSPDGDDATAEAGRITLPYLTIEAAVAAAVSGDLIYVYAGTYTVAASIQKDGLTYYFQPDTTVNYSATLFDDTAAAMTITVRGFGNFVKTGVPTNVYFISMVNASTFNFEFNEITSTSDSTFVCSDGDLRIVANTITETTGKVFDFSADVTFDITVGTISNINTTSSSLLYCSALSSGRSFFNCNLATNNADDTMGAITVTGCSITHFIIIKAILSHTKIGGINFASGIYTNGGYVDYQGFLQSNCRCVVMRGAVGTTSQFVYLHDTFIKKITTACNEAIRVNNTGSWFKTKNCTIYSQGIYNINSGTADALTDSDAKGNCELYSTLLFNTFDDKVNPAVAILKNGTSTNNCVIDDVQCYMQNSVVSYFLYTSDAVPPNKEVKILAGGATGNVDVQAASFLNIISGTNYLYDTDFIVNTYQVV